MDAVVDPANTLYDAVIVGGGPAGMTAAVFLAEKGLKPVICERNKLLGRKLRITGKGRCNVTNAKPFDEFCENIVAGRKFMLSAFSRFSNTDLISWLNENGLATVTERGGRVFPESQRAYDVAELLVKMIKRLRIPVIYGFDVKQLLISDCEIKGVSGTCGGRELRVGGKTVLIAAGGFTYRGTGSDGSGYRLAMSAGHTVEAPAPSLIALICREKGACAAMQGLTLRNTAVRLKRAGKTLFEDFGELMFTDKGVTGPVILSLSRFFIFETVRKGTAAASDPAVIEPYLRFDGSVYGGVNADNSFTIELDLKPALSESMLDARLTREFDRYPNRKLSNIMPLLLPSSMCGIILDRCAVAADRTASSVTREERKRIAGCLKCFTLTPAGPDDPDHGIVSQGGVALKEIDPKSFASKKCDGLFFAGEVMDVDGLTGGYNLTVAFSSGRAAADGIANRVNAAEQLPDGCRTAAEPLSDHR